MTFSVGVWAFVIGLNQISSFFLLIVVTKFLINENTGFFNISTSSSNI